MKTRSRIFVWILAPLIVCIVWFCVSSQRPPFANEYRIHPDGRPPWPRWWIHPPLRDGSGITARADHTTNVLIVHIPEKSSLSLDFVHPGYRVFDENNNLILTTGSAAKTPDIVSARDRLFILIDRQRWYEFDTPREFAQRFESPNAPPVEGDINLIERLKVVAKNEEMNKLNKWLGDRN